MIGAKQCAYVAAMRMAAIVVLTGSFLWPCGAVAQTGVERLQEFLDSVRTLRAVFEQEVLDSRGQPVQEGRGTFALFRPGRFRWNYREPYEQIIVADGERVWVYDVDLEQVTVRPQDEALSQTPAMLLSGTAQVDQRFVVEDLGEREGLQWVELRPREQESNFERVRLGFRGVVLTRMEMVDAFEQLTTFRFEEVQVNIEIDDDVFQFTPPPGVDVVGE